MPHANGSPCIPGTPCRAAARCTTTNGTEELRPLVAVHSNQRHLSQHRPTAARKPGAEQPTAPIAASDHSSAAAGCTGTIGFKFSSITRRHCSQQPGAQQPSASSSGASLAANARTTPVGKPSSPPLCPRCGRCRPSDSASPHAVRGKYMSSRGRPADRSGRPRSPSAFCKGGRRSRRRPGSAAWSVTCPVDAG